MPSTKAKQTAKEAQAAMGLVPAGVASVAAEILHKQLSPYVVANHAYDTHNDAILAGFRDLGVQFRVPKSSASKEQTLGYIKPAANKMAELLKDLSDGDKPAFLAFAVPNLLTKAFTLGGTYQFGPVIVGCILWDAGDDIGVELQVTVLANQR